MKIKVIASTKVGYELPKTEAISFSGKSAGICYLPDSVEKLLNEDGAKTERRVRGNIASGHHSVFGHTTYNFILEDVPKILAMVLNNEKIYNTSEKSARYTVMKMMPDEENLYNKWVEIFEREITMEYHQLDEKKIRKLAQENARYLVSIFTPGTVMEYSVSLRQLNYIIGWAREYINNSQNTDFSNKLKDVLREFVNQVSYLEVPGLESSMKNRHFSIFSTRSHLEEFGENYSTNYLASFAQLAQAQRHRTLSYEMELLKNPRFYIPHIIRNTRLEVMWLEDMEMLKLNYPQGMLIKVNERGTIENFVLKCMERLCGAAQLEIMEQTEATLRKYLAAVFQKPELHKYLLPYTNGSRCTFPGWKCNSPCIFGGKYAMYRSI